MLVGNIGSSERLSYTVFQPNFGVPPPVEQSLGVQ